MNGQPEIPGKTVSYLELATLPNAPFWARRQTRAALRSWHIAPETADTAELLVSELVSNASKFGGGDVSHAGQADSGNGAVKLISLTLRNLPDRLIIEVADPSPRPPVLTSADSQAESGRGLMLVQALSKEWGYASRPGGGKVVYCVLASTAVGES